MRLSQKDVALFHKLNPPLLFYVNQQIGVIRDISTLDEFMRSPLEEKVEVRDALYENIELLDSFIKENPAGLSPEELETVNSWKNFAKKAKELGLYFPIAKVSLQNGFRT